MIHPSWTLRPAQRPSDEFESTVAAIWYMDRRLWEGLLTAFHSNSSDLAIAKQFRVSEAYVWRVRNTIGIPSSVVHRSALTTQFVGKIFDSVVANWLGVSPVDIIEFRERHGVPEYDPNRKPSEEELLASALVATNVAILLGSTPIRVRRARALGVTVSSLYPETSGKPIKVVTPEPTVDPRPRRQKFPFDWSTIPFETATNYELVTRYGVSRTDVHKRRLEAGIASPPDRRFKHSGIDWDALPLSTTSLSKLSQMTGASKSTIRRARAARPVKA